MSVHSQRLLFLEGRHLFRSRSHMHTWLTAHGFDLDGGWDSERMWSYWVAPEGWDMIDEQWDSVDLALTDDRASIYAVDGVEWPTIDHREEP
jgi:hypothetical protein